MAFTGKILAQGQLPNAKGTLYTCPALTKAYVRFFRVSNPSGGTETVIVYYKKATSRQIGRAVLLTLETVDFVTDAEVLVLDAGDLIEGVTTTATTVDYIIAGATEA
jgi:hypothetical protein